MKNIIIIASICLLFVSCISTRQFAEFPLHSFSKEKARIYVLRSSYMSIAVQSSIFCNNELIGKTLGSSYLCWEVDDGYYTIVSTQKSVKNSSLGTSLGDDVFIVNAKKGHTYYLKQVALLTGGFTFVLLDNDKGKKYIENRKAPKFNFTSL